MDESRQERIDLATFTLDDTDQAGDEWEAFHVDLRVRRPLSEQRLPMADHEPYVDPGTVWTSITAFRNAGWHRG